MSRSAHNQFRAENDNERTPPARFLVEGDQRADDKWRRVRIDAAKVTIARRCLGVAMNVVVPSSCYRGVVLASCVGKEAGLRFVVKLEHRDADLTVRLLAAADGGEVIAEWTAWAKFLCLPRFIETSPGRLIKIDRTLGKLALGDRNFDRRLTKTIAKRRPRFLANRKAGRCGSTRAEA